MCGYLYQGDIMTEGVTFNFICSGCKKHFKKAKECFMWGEARYCTECNEKFAKGKGLRL